MYSVSLVQAGCRAVEMHRVEEATERVQAEDLVEASAKEGGGGNGVIKG